VAGFPPIKEQVMTHIANWSDPVPPGVERPPLRSRITLPATADHIAKARRFVAGFVGDATVVADAVLCLSEVATNAVMHSNSRSTGRLFTVSAELHDDGCVRIEVEDEGGRWIVRPKPEGQSHLGLMIVRELASAWGIEGDGSDRRVVWFELRPAAAALPFAA
jgi:anti-sigma regulatory factor (Ser/Thr protein kinase)